MGSGTSKPAPSSTEHVFSSETPVRFSPDLINALQASSDSDVTRASDFESHIQARVNAELQRLNAKADESLKDLESKLSTAATDSADGIKQPGAPDQAFRFEDSKTKDLSRAKVQEEIDALKQKLERRKLRDNIANDKKVEKAKADVVSCLRINDRRPLDCWQEVETFKKEVSRLEKQFLGRVLES